MDSDDEVRDRATFYMNVLQQKQKALNAAYIFNGKLQLVFKIKEPSRQFVCQVGDVLSLLVCVFQDFLFPFLVWRSPSISTPWSPQRNLLI